MPKPGEKPPDPIILQYRYEQKRWGTGAIRARLAPCDSLSQAQEADFIYTCAPDILELQQRRESGVSTVKLALKPKLPLPPTNKASIHVKATPAAAAGGSVGSAAAAATVGFETDIEIILVPYGIKLRVIDPGAGGKVEEPGGPIGIEADGQSVRIIGAEIVEVDAEGSPTGREVAGGQWDVKCTKPSDALKAEASSTADPGPNRCMWQVSSSRVIPSGGDAGTPQPLHLGFTVKLPDGRVAKRVLVCNPQPVTVTIEATPEDRKLERRGGPPGTVKVRVESPGGRRLKGVSVDFKLKPEQGTLSSSSCTTDENGEVKTTYTPPATPPADGAAKTGPLVVTIETYVGPDQVKAGEVAFEVMTWLTIPLRISKPGFADWTRDVKFESPGTWTLNVVTAAGHDSANVLYATVSGSDLKATEKGSGSYTVDVLGGTGGGSLPDAALDLAGEIKEVIQKIKDVLKQPNPPAVFQEVTVRMVKFLEEDLPKRLAEEKVEEYAKTATNLRALAVVARVLPKSMELIGRRFSRLKADLGAFYQVFMKLVIGIFEEKLPAALVSRLKRGAKWAIGVIGGYAGRGGFIKRVMDGALGAFRAGMTMLDGFLDRLKSKIESRWSGGAGAVPPNVRARIPGDNRSGPLPHTPGSLSQGSAAVQAAIDALQKARKAVERLTDSLASAKNAVIAAEHQLTAHQDKVRRLRAEIFNARKAGQSAAAGGISQLASQLKAAEASAAEATKSIGKAASAQNILSQQLRDAQKTLTAAQTCKDDVAKAVEWADAAFTDIFAGFNRMINTLGAMLLLIVGKLADFVGPWCKAVINKFNAMFPGGLDSPTGDDPLAEAVLKFLVEWVKDKLAEFLGKSAYDTTDYVLQWERTLADMQLKAAAACLDKALQKTMTWGEVDDARSKAAVLWYYNSVEGSSFEHEKDEAYQYEFIGSTVDTFVSTLTSIGRWGNLVVSIVGLIASIPTAGAGTGGAFLLKLTLTQTTEAIDGLLDQVKFFATAGRSIQGCCQVAGYIPSFTKFTAMFYGDPAVLDWAAKNLRTK